MSIEKSLERIAAALEIIAKKKKCGGPMKEIDINSVVEVIVPVEPAGKEKKKPVAKVEKPSLPPVPVAPPVEKKKVTLKDAQDAVTASIKRIGTENTTLIVNILNSLGAPKVSELKPSQYEELIQKVSSILPNKK